MAGSRPISLELRIAWTAVAVTLGVLLVFGAASFFVNKQFIEERERAAGQREIAVAAVRMEDALVQATRELSSLARNPLTANALVDSFGRDTYMVPFMRSHWLVSTAGLGVSLCDFAGETVVAAGGMPDLCAAATRAVRLDTLEAPAGTVVDGPGGEQLLLAFPVIFVGTGQSEGAIVAAYPLREIVQTARGPGGGEFQYAVDTGNADSAAVRPGRLLVASQALDLPPPLEALGIRIYQYTDSAAALQPLRELAWTYLGTAVVAVVVIAFLAVLAAKRVARPIVALAQASRELAADINTPVALPESGDREVSQLAGAFSTMVGALRESRTGLEARIEQRTADLQDSEERSRAIVENALDCIVTIDEDGRITEFNPAAERVFGHPRAEALGRRMAELIIPPALRQAHHDGMRRYQESGHGPILGRRVEVQAMRASGECFDAELAVTPVRVGERTLFTAYLRDLSERKKAEALVVEHTRRLDAVFALSPDGFVVLDADDRLSFVNPAFEEMVGLPAARLLGQHRDEFDRLLREAADVDEPFPATPGADGEQRDWGAETLYLNRPKRRVLQRRLRRGDQGPAQTVLYFRDVSHEREVDRMKSEFLSTAAHELRTPMASILGFSELLLTDEHDAATRRELLGTINAQSRLLTGMVNELLDLARIEARRNQDFELEWIDPGVLARRTVAALLVPGDRREVTLRIGPTLPRVRVDAARMQQALTNLLSNAFKYSPEGGEIVLELSAPEVNGDPLVRIRVADEGIGMTAAQLERACERFYRADASGNIPGTGLGLSLVKEIVELHGGRLQLESESGRGTVATIELPAGPA